jgi:hypothetical protein
MPQPTPPASHRPPSSASLRPQVLPLVPDLGRPPDEGRPLPDATSVRRLAVPDSAPPFDDEFQAAGPDQALTAARPHRAASPPSAADSPPSAAGSPHGPAGSPQRAATGADGTNGSPDGSWPGKFAQVLAETLAGARPPRQMVPWTTEQARRHIRRLGPMLAASERPLVCRVVASQPTTDVVEMTVVARFGPRVRALAVRLERDGPHRAGPGRAATPARWRCTAVEAALPWRQPDPSATCYAGRRGTA